MDSNVPVGLATTTQQSSGRDRDDVKVPMWQAAQVGPQVDPDHQDHGDRFIPRD
jgi:hypothetical protein